MAMEVKVPQPAPKESPEQKEPDAQAESAPSSTVSSAADSTFIGDPGPAFESDGDYAREGFAPPEPGADLGAPPPVELGWEEDSVRSILTAKGAAVHALAGVAEADWIYTEADLMAIAAPLTRILNRYPVTQAAAGAGDELAVAIGFGGYAMRSYTERKVELEAQEEVEHVPASGRVAEPDTGPQPQPEEEPPWTTE
ncbi:MAG: hypothetical protein ACJ75S_08585 [Solirubrobacterales bacterium]